MAKNRNKIRYYGKGKISRKGGLPSMASVKTATKPMDSMNQCTDNMRYVMAAPTAQTTSIMSRYD